MAILKGDNHANELYGTKGNDKYYGFGGDDYFYAGSGADYLNGGAGFDTVNYAGLGRAISVNLSKGIVNKGAGGKDTLVEVERVTGTDFDDVFVGGSSGESWFRGGLGNDKLTGGGGFDWADYNNASGAVKVDLNAGRSSGGGTGRDTLIDIDNVRGSNFADTITGSDGENRIRAKGGDDIVDGRGGVDMIDYKEAPSSVTVNLAKGVASGGDGNDTISNIESVRGSYFNDKLIGDKGDNYLWGMGGNDVLQGGGGSDFFNGDVGKDRMTGGAGADTFAFFYASDSGTTASTRDMITDFAVGTDKLNLSWMDANTEKSGFQSFQLQETEGADFTGVAGQLHFRFSNGNTLVEADLDGDKSADFQIELTGTKHMTSDDFLL